MVSYLLDYFTFKEFCLLTVIVYIVMCWYNLPTVERTIAYIKEQQVQTDQKNNIKYEESSHVYVNNGIAYFACMSNGAGWGRIIGVNDKKYVLCTTFTGRDILKK